MSRKKKNVLVFFFGILAVGAISIPTLKYQGYKLVTSVQQQQRHHQHYQQRCHQHQQHQPWHQHSEEQRQHQSHNLIRYLQN